MSHNRRLQRGVSLIEALVAFAIMSFGMLAVVGMQATMRGNADLARQRAEAVRLAQDSIEEWRGFSTVPSAANQMAYQDISGNSTRTVSDPVLYNATYTISRRALPIAAVPQTVTPEMRAVVVDVTWTDRTNQAQSIRLSSSIVGLAPDLSASLVLSTATDPLLAPFNRNPAIPPSAVPVPASVCPSCSGYMPPGQTSGDNRVVWMFDNHTAVITLCTISSSSATTTAELTHATDTECGSGRALLLSGFVRQGPSGTAFTNADAVNPQGPFRPFSVRLERTLPSVLNVPCFQDLPLAGNNAVEYVCAVPLEGNTTWSGSLKFRSPLDIAGDLGDHDKHKVCRYFETHPYVEVPNARTNQNFVIIDGSNGNGASNRCDFPTGTPKTYAHEPR
jgi:Tfp pilus assembly protein PilV